MLKRQPLAGAALVWALVSCSSVEVAEPATSTVVAPPSTTTTTTAPPSTTITARTTTASAPPTTAAPAEPFLPGLDVANVTQLTPRSGAGRRPILSWEPVADAAAYTVLVIAADETPWWSWSGSETEVVLGGVGTDGEIGGPAAGVGVTWVVFAFDGDDTLVGVSPRRELAE